MVMFFAVLVLLLHPRPILPARFNRAAHFPARRERQSWDWLSLDSQLY